MYWNAPLFKTQGGKKKRKGKTDQQQLLQILFLKSCECFGIHFYFEVFEQCFFFGAIHFFHIEQTKLSQDHLFSFDLEFVWH